MPMLIMLHSRGQWFCFAVWWFWHPKGFCRRNAGMLQSHQRFKLQWGTEPSRHVIGKNQPTRDCPITFPWYSVWHLCTQAIFKHAEVQLHFACPEGGSIGLDLYNWDPGGGTPWSEHRGTKMTDLFNAFGPLDIILPNQIAFGWWF
jgi:hypothetical protein